MEVLLKKETNCKCQTGCQNRRCACLRNNEPCDETCGCLDCQNPLNDMDVENLSVCAIQNITAYKALSEADLEMAYKLPCGHESVPLRELLQDYFCEGCSESYWYSFCWQDVVQDSCTWHCEVCG